MKCSRCSTKNIIKATYCKKCGTKFTKKEQELAYSKTIFGKYDLYKKWKDRFSLKFITDSIYFKIIIILVILAAGLYSWYINGLDLKILESDAYEIYYNDKSDEFYLLVNNDVDEVALNLYIPNRIEDIEINHYDMNGDFIKEIEYVKNKEIILETYNSDYYLITSNFSNKEEKSLKVFLYNKENVEIQK